jgi:hypothetical protein
MDKRQSRYRQKPCDQRQFTEGGKLKVTRLRCWKGGRTVVSLHSAAAKPGQMSLTPIDELMHEPAMQFGHFCAIERRAAHLKGWCARPEMSQQHILMAPAPAERNRGALVVIADRVSLPARIVYISATGATSVHNLACAQRLGLWGSSDFPFANRADFVAAVEAGGIYIARSLSYEGIEVEIVEHELTSEQIRIYDAYTQAFQIIHANLEAALKAVNITGESKTLNSQAKAAAKSAFESNKQLFSITSSRR